MDYDVVLVDVDEEECQPVFPVRPGAKQPDPLSGSASTGGSSGRGDAAGPPQLSLGSETVTRETDERSGQSCDGSPHAIPLVVSAWAFAREMSGSPP